MLQGGSTGRLVGLVGLATLLAAVGPMVAARSRLVAGLGAVVAAAAALAIAGVPVNWIVNMRLAVTGRAIGDGLSTLADVNVPYGGVDEWVRVTIMLGAAVLLLTGALVLTFMPPNRGYLRLAGAVLPLLSLAVIPATTLRPALPYVEGVLIFGLLVLFLWGDQLERNRMAGVLLPCGVAAALALMVGPSLDHHHPWINYRSLAAGLGSNRVETFDWTQRYGPLHWPRTRRPVLEIQAPRPEYWKAQNLDVFDGLGWTAGSAPVISPWQAHISASALRKWTQTLEVTVRSMSSDDIIAAGSAERPADVPGGAEQDLSPGTWLATRGLEPGVSYRVKVYSPHPSPAQLTTAGTSYPASLRLGYLSLQVPETRADRRALAAGGGDQGIVSYTPGSGYLVRVVFPSFATTAVRAQEAGSAVVAAMRSSPYAGAFALAQRLQSGATTPYAYLLSVEQYLAHGFRYDENPPTSAYPLESFLLKTKLGYCQHFAGAMALLLRMGGVPARVAVGFTQGTYDSSLGRWTVIDSDAHAWVEAWFPHYGWVRFDPTPRADPALGGHGSPWESQAGINPAAKVGAVGFGNKRGDASPTSRARAGNAGGEAASTILEVVAPLAAVSVLIALALLVAARDIRDPVAELAQAFARAGRPLKTQATLAAVEQRLADTPEAVAYVRSLRLARFASSTAPLSLRRRRALRRALAQGLGLTGRLRALWALPPRWKPAHPWKDMRSGGKR